MLGLINFRLKQARFYQEIAEEERREGMQEGLQIGRLEGERLFLKKQLNKRFWPFAGLGAAKAGTSGN